MHYLDDFEITWDGGPLLPNRPTLPDDRWNGVPVILLGEKEAYAETKKQKRVYNKTNSGYWDSRGKLPDTPTDEGWVPRGISTLRDRSVGTINKNAATTTGDRGQSSECIQEFTTDTARTDQEQTP